MRRVATRAWWTSSASTPVRTPGSCAMRRAVDDAIAARSTSSGVDAKSSGAGRREIGRIERAGAEGPHDLGHEVGAPGARGLQPVLQRVDDRGGCGFGELHLELAEARGEAGAVEHRDLVVDDLGELLAAGIADDGLVAHRVELADLRERLAPDERVDEIDGGHRRLPGVAVDQELEAGEHLLARHRQLDHPTFVVAVPQAGAGPGEPQIARCRSSWPGAGS